MQSNWPRKAVQSPPDSKADPYSRRGDVGERAGVAAASPTCELLSVSGPEAITASTETFTPFGLLRLQNPQQRPANGASSNEQPSEPARIVDVERQKYLTPNSGACAPTGA